MLTVDYECGGGFLVEKLEEVLECYDIEWCRMFRGRKMLMCEAVDGRYYGICESHAKNGRLYREYLVKQYLMEHGGLCVDQLVYNRDGAFITMDKYHTPHIVKQFYTGREADIMSLAEVADCAANLARVHKCSEGIADWYVPELKAYVKRRTTQDWLEKMQSRIREETGEDASEEMLLKEHQRELESAVCSAMARVETVSEGVLETGDFVRDCFAKRNRELKRIGMYMRKPGRKGDFVEVYNACSAAFAKRGEACLAEFDRSVERELSVRWGLRHGAYQHHNVLKLPAGWATVAWERFQFGPQMMDLYDFLRKVLEKNNYKMTYANAVVRGYQEQIALTRDDFVFLYAMLSYPEKFWKISNHYYNSKKTWVPPKMVEKLSNVVQQNQEKEKFLVKFKKNYLDLGE